MFCFLPQGKAGIVLPYYITRETKSPYLKLNNWVPIFHNLTCKHLIDNIR